MNVKTKISIAMALVALAPFSLAACGGDDEGDTESQPTAEQPQANDGATAEATTVEISAVPDGSFAYEQESVEARAGDVTIDFTNPAALGHDVQVEGPDGDVGGTDVISEDTTSATITLAPGDYTFYCSVAGHREGGMEGDLTVE